MGQEYIEIRGARVNNLKDISLLLPRGKFIVITGVSGSGKSSLAFDTLYAEGQRRYVESLSAYARQFLGRMRKPDCDFISGIPPAIAIQQRVITRNPRSTVGTSTEIYDYLRMLYAHLGHTFSPVSGQEVKKQSTEDIVRTVLSYSRGTRFALLAPVILPEGRTMKEQLEMYKKQGYARIFTGGSFVSIDDMALDGMTAADEVWLVVDRLTVDDSKDGIARLVDSAETALFEGHDASRLLFLPANISYDFSTRFEADGIRFQEPSEQLFSFNSPAGACPVCEGFGSIIGIDEHLVIPNTALSVSDGCVLPWHGEKMKMWKDEFCRRAVKDNFPIFEPYRDLTDKQRGWLWHGLPSDRYRDKHDRVSIDNFFLMVKENQYKIQYRVMMSRYRGKTICPACHGTRLKKEANYVMIGGRNISDLVQMPITQLKEWFGKIVLSRQEMKIGARLLTEINSRLGFLIDVGLGYLTLNRASNTLSGGESQRINLSTNLGSALVGSLYILDEPSIGLHRRDTARLIKVLKELRDIGNTVIVVEHDEEIIRAADWLVDIGPYAGRLGGEIVYSGPQPREKNENHSLTLSYLSGKLSIPVPQSRRAWNEAIEIKGARLNNLKGIDVILPLNVLTAVTGVSGSGKSSLIKGILYPAMKRHLGEVAEAPGEYLNLGGAWKKISHVEFVNQNPIGKSSRSNPATYLKAYDAIRDLFAEQPLAKQMGFTSQYFSFNVDGGRCDECKGEGVITVEMQFMADITLECQSCHGQRFKREILDVRYKGKNISEVLDMTVSEAIIFFGQGTVSERLQPLENVGLGYIKLGQSSSTLSGGENQRVKLAYFIGQPRQEPTLFIFDEPTTGLHFHDINRLLQSLYALISRGHSIIVIEHNMDIIKSADYIIDLGPEGGEHGGYLIAQGTPEDIASSEKSVTGYFLKNKLKGK